MTKILMETVVEESWPAITVVGEEIPEIGGRLYGAMVYDLTTGQSYVVSEGPVSLPFGNLVEVACNYSNKGTVRCNMRCTVYLLDPNGTIRAERSTTRALDPNSGTECSHTPAVALDEGGTWQIYATLEAEVA